MEYGTFVTVFFYILKISTADDEEVCCAPRFVDALRCCPDFDNQKLNGAALIMGFQTDDEDSGGLRMSGAFDISMDIDDEYEVEIIVKKLTDLGKEYMYGACASICTSLKNKDAPWTPLFESVNITGCPVYQGIYPISEVVLNLDFAQDLMKHEFCGEYEVEFSVSNGLEMMSCHIMTLEIYEKTK